MTSSAETADASAAAAVCCTATEIFWTKYSAVREPEVVRRRDPPPLETFTKPNTTTCDARTDDSNCPAIGGASPPSWVGSDYFCATGNPSTTWNARTWYDTPLFAADWFPRSLPSSVSDDVEARLIATHDSADEDLGVARLILRVR